MCIFLVKKLSGGVKNRKNRHAGGPNAKMPNLFFHIQGRLTMTGRRKTIAREKKYNALLKRGILLTHRNFPEKPRPKRGGQNRLKNTREWQKTTCIWWPLGLGMRLHCENIIKNGLFWPFFHFKLL